MTDETAYVRAYARALGGAARDTGTLPEVRQDLARVLQALTDSVDLRRWVACRVPAAPARRAAEVRQRLSGLAGETTLRLLEQMAAWNHLHHVPAVAARLEADVRRAEGRRTARAIFAQPPAADTIDVLRRRLVAIDPRLELDVREDPALLAGLTVRIEDQVVDASLAGRLSRLRQALTGPARAAAGPA